jgi:hypothetical protein
MVQNLSYLVLILCNSQKVPLLEKQIYIEDNNDQRRILFKLSLYLILFNCQKVPLIGQSHSIPVYGNENICTKWGRKMKGLRSKSGCPFYFNTNHIQSNIRLEYPVS